ncbi:cobalt-zinc-cadmium efflux system membrane fusion protein [Algoriphagus boseongensis]|uniref:Cobalt-zinc-cadmium efflux system membrane fusion protein n=1 Tax=Algoriphagus boseongensis TaxID=1442587 RepID=A0A4R6T7W5_9BACT|nr:efflux RND transporter periplasmic adaptor subunit [Algoriphagus boseongensis]TDQ18269.1 cobalt-zinc-cadmium efflux system membrane fusion protein [Algoriphagus boseongensis]
MKRILQVHVFVFALILLGTGCGSGESGGDSSIEVGEAAGNDSEVFVTSDQFNAMNMEWGKPEKETFSEEVNLQAMVKVPVEGMVEVSAYFGGFVSDFKLVEGQPVRKGEVLFNLENPDFIRIQQDYLETSSQLAYLKSEFERQKTLYGEQIASQKNFLKAEADYQASLAKTQSLKKQLSLIQINADQLTPQTIRSKVPVVSPITGFVDQFFVVPGAFLPASGKAVSLISKEHLHVELMVFEKDVTKIHKGQKVKLSSIDIPGEMMEAEVYMVGQVINESRQTMVHCHILDESKEEKLVPGMYLEAKLQLEPTERWSVPTRAIIEVEGEQFILVKMTQEAGGIRMKKIKVQTFETNPEVTAIELPAGMDPEVEVLVRGAFYLM